MSYEDLVTKRAEREAKDQAKTERKGKRGQKHKSPLEADNPGPSKGKHSRKGKSPIEVGATEPQAKTMPLSKVSKPARLKWHR
jgi:hypothetical protein